MSSKLRESRSLQIEAVLSEYRALYGLAEFRLHALDNRIPMVGGALTAFLGTVPLLPDQSQVLGLIAVPVSLIWLVRTTINHARSFEDALRGIECAEQKLNGLLGEGMVEFQSTHPSRQDSVGGRTGVETVTSVVLGSCLLLLICLWMSTEVSGVERGTAVVYACGIAVTASCLIHSVRTWSSYRYKMSKNRIERSGVD